MGYEFKSRVRYSEIGEDHKLTLNSVLNYFQDCSTFQSEAIGLGLETLAEKKKVWLLISWQICVNRYPKLGESITVRTWPYGFKGFYGYRNFHMLDEKGGTLAYANAIWCFMDLKLGRPCVVPKEEVEGYTLEEKYNMNYASRKVRLPQEYEVGTSFTVKKQHLDTNHHVNNGAYIQMAMNYLQEGVKVKEMRAEYKVQALLGDVMIPHITRAKKGCTIALCDLNEKPYVVVEFQY